MARKRGPSFKSSAHPRDANGRFKKKGSSSGTVARRPVRAGVRVPRVYTAETRRAITSGAATSRPLKGRTAGVIAGVAVTGAGVYGYRKYKSRKKKV